MSLVSSAPKANVEGDEYSTLISRIRSTMVVGDAHPPASTGSESIHHSHDASTHPRHSSASATPTQYSVADNAIGRSRASSNSLHVAHPTSISHEREAPQIRFPGGPSQDFMQEHDGADSDHEVRTQAQPLPSAALPPPSPRLQPTYRSTVSLNSSLANSPSRIKVRDLSHIQSFASEEVLTRSRHPSRHSLRGRLDGGQQYEISSMPVTDIIEMVAGLLTKITTTNDRQHEHLHRHIPLPEGSPGLSQQAASVLAFHGKNVPSITIASYLSRIHKYCPTTYEVFLSLLVYFDRMTETVNSGTVSSFADDEQQNDSRARASSIGSSATAGKSSPMRSPRQPDPEPQARPGSGSKSVPQGLSDADAYDLSHFFVVDSFNIHRLVMAGVTCASKFFSDVFYTNSRYAKVGGLPLVELNHLELQFLLLNDFRLSVPIEELEAYGTMLVEFYAREVVSQQQGNHAEDGLHMQTPRPP